MGYLVCIKCWYNDTMSRYYHCTNSWGNQNLRWLRKRTKVTQLVGGRATVQSQSLNVWPLHDNVTCIESQCSELWSRSLADFYFFFFFFNEKCGSSARNLLNFTMSLLSFWVAWSHNDRMWHIGTCTWICFNCLLLTPFIKGGIPALGFWVWLTSNTGQMKPTAVY